MPHITLIQEKSEGKREIMNGGEREREKTQKQMM